MRINLSINKQLLEKFDEVVDSLGETRSGLIQVLIRDLVSAKSVPSGYLKDIARKLTESIPVKEEFLLKNVEINKKGEIVKAITAQKEMKMICPIHGGTRMGVGYTCCEGS